MKRKPYTVQEKEILLQSEAIVKVTNSSATYLKEFKVFAVGEYMTGKTPLQIFIEAGPEIAVATTKAYILQVAIMALLSYRVAYSRYETEELNIPIESLKILYVLFSISTIKL